LRYENCKAGEGGRTLNIQLGRLTLCQLSYARVGLSIYNIVGGFGKGKPYGGWDLRFWICDLRFAICDWASPSAWRLQFPVEHRGGGRLCIGGGREYTCFMLSLLSQLCAIPTAPFKEHRVMEFVERFAGKYRAIKLSRDRFDNTLLLRPGKSGAKHPRLIFVAHLDHPGFIAGSMVDAKTLSADFHGGVMAKFMADTPVVFFDGDREVRGKIIDLDADKTGRATAARIRVKSSVSAGSMGMFDLTTGAIKGKRFHCRVCDDLAGAASALATLQQLASAPAHVDVGVLLTRGEEQGFVGAIGAVSDGSLLRKTDRLLSIECSAEQPVAQQGLGVVVRVGDRTSTFNSAFTRFIAGVGDELAKADKSFKMQRALMPGGTCEATVFDAWGYTAAAACVPLGNYHNMDRARERIAAEYVNTDDWLNMVKLFVALSRKLHTFTGNHAELKTRLLHRFETFRSLITPRGKRVSGA
jgi:putative aminopeptidase FrvX